MPERVAVTNRPGGRRSADGERPTAAAGQHYALPAAYILMSRSLTAPGAAGKTAIRLADGRGLICYTSDHDASFADLTPERVALHSRQQATVQAAACP
ncbi:MAG TPA: hypothetical protein VMC03_02840 [Streptosporangiaceae bacterium]|nr:hypothetical protein [Streptosporangiaceae bacterium]